mmetsp:Transcript_724/g.1004  ORF Transcript_724/g.1004 Transcript_724/m.1004 type:complete len:161 (+) Transcript_724:225-707(+)
MQFSSLSVLLIATLFFATNAFSPTTHPALNDALSTRRSKSRSRTIGQHSISTTGRTTITSTTNPSPTMTSLNSSPDDKPDIFAESDKRGKVLFAISLLAVAWSFSIPPELRREHWCFTDKCAENRTKCYDCITFKEFYGQVKDYYANGGGINFDFSIEGK